MKYLIIALCMLCLVGCKEEKTLIIPGNIPDEFFENTPIYQCEKCGSQDTGSYIIRVNDSEEGTYCLRCMKELADKYLPKMKEVKNEAH